MDIRYAAGLFDGEGYVRITKWHKPNSPHIRYSIFCGIGMTHRPIIEAYQQRFSGSLAMNRHDLRSPKNRVCFIWNVASQKAATFLREIVPHLIVKKAEAEIAIALQDHIDNNPYRVAGRNHLRSDREAILAHRENLFHQIAALKSISFPLLHSGPMSQ